TGSCMLTPPSRPLRQGQGGPLKSAYGGASSNLSRAFFMTTLAPPFLPSATLNHALYELAGVGSPSPILRLVNVQEGSELRSPFPPEPFLGANLGGGTGNKGGKGGRI